MIDAFMRLKEQIAKYNPDSDFQLIEKAYNFSTKAHKGQERVSGILISFILSKWGAY